MNAAMHAPFTYVCPRCHAPLEQTAPDEFSCPADGFRFLCIDGIWRFLPPERAVYFEKFIREYETVRRAEGRGSQDVAYYRALPYRDLSGKMTSDWRIRAASFDMLLEKIISPKKRPLNILDLGAGNGWLSNQLVKLGHTVAAVDLMTNDFDGLGCWRFYDASFTPVQAEYDHLPFTDGNVDLVIFNASLHYSVNILETLAESLRVLHLAGKLVILDSPVYRDAGSGEKMVKERESQFVKRYGFPSNALPSENYLTYSKLDELAATLKLKWRYFTPFYGLKWELRPFLSRIHRTREPAKFHVIVGSRNSI